MASDGFALTKSELLPNSEKNSGADTLGGFLIEAVHNAISSPVALSAKEKQERSQHSDQLATIVADSIAMLPGMRTATAGFLRASSLIRINSSGSEIVGNYAKD